MYGDTRLNQFYEALLAHYGRQHWWPGDGPFEVMVGAVLTQNTNWNNVAKAIGNLKAAGKLSAEALDELEPNELAVLIRPAGYYNIKARRLGNLVRWFLSEYDGSIEALVQRPVDTLREELLGINGIGRETADSIILYALNKTTFVVDTYTYRVLARHGCIDTESDYEEIKDYCQRNLPEQAKLYNELHALIVRVGKEHCKPRPRCDGCPLERFEHTIEDRSTGGG